MITVVEGKYSFAKKCLGFRHASASTFRLSLKPFFDDIDAILLEAHRDEPKVLHTDQSLNDRIREITQKHGDWIWSDDPATRNRVLVGAKVYAEYQKDLYWSNEEQRKMTHPRMIEMVVGYLQLKRKRDARRKNAKMRAKSVMGVGSQDGDEGVHEEGGENRGNNQQEADRVEESNQEDGANGEHQDRRKRPSYQIGGRELLQGDDEPAT
ncbi:hypothetical protein AC579_161 [Pseudocercospora musae]|uniref:Uncharacterized protein n=1 Tax=Pseudocercospora musae TaxID=113226 RepID=A0A139IA53_9PEZI|nr:hypothetical protein AC579_161 [Pseudocercospora musae]